MSRVEQPGWKPDFTDPETQDLLELNRQMVKPLLFYAASFEAMIEDGRWPGGLLATWPPVHDEQRFAVQLGRWRNWLVMVEPKIFNHRVVLWPDDDVSGYDHGWCYPDPLRALLAVSLWDPTESGEPADYVKRATPRRPPLPDGVS